MNKFLKLLCSIPVILIALYFIPFLGICLLLFRYYIYKNKKFFFAPICLICIGIVAIALKYVNDIIKIAYLNNIINTKFLSFGKLLITVGIIFLILSFIFRNLYNKISSKVNSGINDYMNQDLKKDYEIRKENDLKMQEKREKSKNTHVVHCPYCGSDNMLTEQTGTCKFCRKHIEYKS